MELLIVRGGGLVRASRPIMIILDLSELSFRKLACIHDLISVSFSGDGFNKCLITVETSRPVVAEIEPRLGTSS